MRNYILYDRTSLNIEKYGSTNQDLSGVNIPIGKALIETPDDPAFYTVVLDADSPVVRRKSQVKIDAIKQDRANTRRLNRAQVAAVVDSALVANDGQKLLRALAKVFKLDPNFEE